jgi:hypothetical protein
VFGDELDGICTNCVVLSGNADATDKSGRRLELGDGVYNHHIIMSDFGKKPTGARLMAKCNGSLTYGFQIGQTGTKDGRGGMGGMMMGMGREMGLKASTNPASQKAPATSVTVAATETPNLLNRLVTVLGNIFQERFYSAVFIGKGGEASATVFADPTKSIKTGYAIGQKDRITVTMELINYDEVEKEIYLTLDYEYLPNAPIGYLDVGMGAINSDGCGAMAIRMRSSSSHKIVDIILMRRRPTGR